MVRSVLFWIGVTLASASVVCAAPQAVSSSDLSQHRAVLDKYCVTCHNERLKTAGLTLDKMDIGQVPQGASVWEKVVRKLRTGAMPPAGLPRPDKATYDSLATYLESAIDREAAAHPNPGKPVVHRLNRAEYINSVKDLLALDIDGAALLPADESSNGFDNLGEGLTVSPMLLERYMSAASKVARLAVGDPAAPPVFETYELSRYLMQEDRMSEDLPFESRGGLAVKHNFPLDGEYVVKVRLQRDFRDRIRGMGEPHDLDVRIDGTRVHTFTIGGQKMGKSAPVFSTAGQGDPEQEHYELTADDALEARFQAKAGTRLVQVAFLKEPTVPEGALEYVDVKPDALPRLVPFDYAEYKGGDPTVDNISIGGPFKPAGLSETPSRRKIFACRPTVAKDEETCAKKIISSLAHRAYRRPTTNDDLQTLLDFYRQGSKGKGGFEAGIELALQRILVGPEFLFRVERDPANTPPDTAYRIGDLDLASRLSFLLWSDFPDEQLLDLAERGKLREPGVLERQVKRMLADKRSKSLVTNFASEWLYLRNLSSARPDPDAFPDFEDNLRDAFLQETQLFFESVMREDRSVLDLLDADYTYLNERLARHYGIPNIYGSHFRRVKLSDGLRGGLLSQGSILMVTSYANRTAPTIRGKWVLENILGSPPPPPPPNVPSLKDTKDTRSLTMRQRMEQHRANPACAVCHTRMDPLGFALENFDAIGRWRDTDMNKPIDPSGSMPDGVKFEGPAGLRKVLQTKRDEFVGTVTEKLLTYALGRPVEYYDQTAIRSILREASANDYRWSSLVIGIVKSTPFQMRRTLAQ